VASTDTCRGGPPGISLSVTAWKDVNDDDDNDNDDDNNNNNNKNKETERQE
jgi:hypothetical protein